MKKLRNLKKKKNENFIKRGAPERNLYTKMAKYGVTKNEARHVLAEFNEDGNKDKALSLIVGILRQKLIEFAKGEEVNTVAKVQKLIKDFNPDVETINAIKNKINLVARIYKYAKRLGVDNFGSVRKIIDEFKPNLATFEKTKKKITTISYIHRFAKDSGVNNFANVRKIIDEFNSSENQGEKKAIQKISNFSKEISNKKAKDIKELIEAIQRGEKNNQLNANNSNVPDLVKAKENRKKHINESREAAKKISQTALNKAIIQSIKNGDENNNLNIKNSNSVEVKKAKEFRKQQLIKSATMYREGFQRRKTSKILEAIKKGDYNANLSIKNENSNNVKAAKKKRHQEIINKANTLNDIKKSFNYLWTTPKSAERNEAMKKLVRRREILELIQAIKTKSKNIPSTNTLKAALDEFKESEELQGLLKRAIAISSIKNELEENNLKKNINNSINTNKEINTTGFKLLNKSKRQVIIKKLSNLKNLPENIKTKINTLVRKINVDEYIELMLKNPKLINIKELSKYNNVTNAELRKTLDILKSLDSITESIKQRVKGKTVSKKGGYISPLPSAFKTIAEYKSLPEELQPFVENKVRESLKMNHSKIKKTAQKTSQRYNEEERRFKTAQNIVEKLKNSNNLNSFLSTLNNKHKKNPIQFLSHLDESHGINYYRKISKGNDDFSLDTNNRNQFSYNIGNLKKKFEILKKQSENNKQIKKRAEENERFRAQVEANERERMSQSASSTKKKVHTSNDYRRQLINKETKLELDKKIKERIQELTFETKKYLSTVATRVNKSLGLSRGFSDTNTNNQTTRKREKFNTSIKEVNTEKVKVSIKAALKLATEKPPINVTPENIFRYSVKATKTNGPIKQLGTALEEAIKKKVEGEIKEMERISRLAMQKKYERSKTNYNPNNTKYKEYTQFINNFIKFKNNHKQLKPENKNKKTKVFSEQTRLRRKRTNLGLNKNNRFNLLGK